MNEKKVDLTNLFKLITSEGNKGGGKVEVLVDFKNTPSFWLNMFVNYTLESSSIVTKLIVDGGNNMDMEDVERARKYIIYHRAWAYIENIDILNSDHVDEIKKQRGITLLKSLNKSIEYFEKKEKYERCQFLLKIKEIIS